MQKRRLSLHLKGVYHYIVMSFGLKNAGATYIKAMTTIFHHMIHKEINVYMDDVIIKSRESLDHLTHIRKFFDCVLKIEVQSHQLRF